MLNGSASDSNVQLRNALRATTIAESEDQAQLRDLARRYLGKVMGEAEVRAAADTVAGVDRSAWRSLAQQQGWQGLAIDERFGGAGYGFAEIAIVIEECGRALAFPSLLVTSVLGVSLLQGCDDEVQAELLPRIAEGEVLLAVVGDLYRTPPTREGRPGTVVAELAADGWTLTGSADFVIDGSAADAMLVRAATADGDALFLSSTGSPGLQSLPMETLDLTRKQARVVFSATPARLVCPADDFQQAWARAFDVSAIALAAEQLGGADRLLQLAVDYAGLREQFGRPIGSFQAIKHKCADLLVDIEAARSATSFAIQAAANPGPELALAASIAQATATEVYCRVAAETVQIHGGIGFTWEHPAHLFFRRAHSDAVLFGDVEQHRRRIGELLGLPGALR
jgi:alkylation response protein AidB-like acyl-CoA dehydrogenase